MKLKRATYRHIETEIHAYHNTCRIIRELRERIIHSSDREEACIVAVGDKYANSTVEWRAIQLADNIMLREMERIIKAIVDTYSRASDQTRLVIWLKYGLILKGWRPPMELVEKLQRTNRHNLSAQDMARILDIDESTFHQHQSEFVYEIAEKLGWY